MRQEEWTSGGVMAQEQRGGRVAMGRAPLGRLLARFAVPTMAGLLLTRLFVLAEGMLVGQAAGLGAMAALTVAAPVVALMNAFASMLGDGVGSMVALALGKGDRARAASAVGNGLIVLLAGAIVLGLALWAATPFAFGLMGASGQAYDEALGYIGILLAGLVPLGFSNGLVTLFRSAGLPARTLGLQSLSAAISLVLALGLISGAGFGVAGAAIARVAGWVCAMVVTVLMLKSDTLPFRLCRASFALRFSLVGRMLSLGAPTLILRLSDALIGAVATAVVAFCGAATAVGPDGCLAALGLVDRVGQFASVFSLGVAVGARPLIGFNAGAGLRHRVRAVTLLALAFSVAGLAAAWVLVEPFASFVVAMFGMVGSEAQFAQTALRVSMIALPLVAVRQVGTNYFQGCGRAAVANGLACCQRLLVTLPLIAAAPLLAGFLPAEADVLAVFVAMAASDVLAAVLVGAVLGRALVSDG